MGATPALLEDLTGTTTRDASFANAAVWESLHSANPGSTGANEITSGAGPGGRQQVAFTSGGAGADDSALQVNIAVAGAVSVPWVGFWTAQTGGTFLGGYPLVGPLLIATGLTSSSVVTCPGHGLAVGNPVRLFVAPNAQSSIPIGLSGDPSVFFVVSVPSGDTLVLSATHGGSPIVLGSGGGFLLAEDETAVFTGGGVLAFAAGNIVYETVS